MIHESLKEYLKHTRIPEKELAKQFGVSKVYISLLRRGQRRPSPELAKKIESLTGIPFENLLFPKESRR